MIIAFRRGCGALLLVALISSIACAPSLTPDAGPDGAALGRIALGFLLGSAGAAALVLSVVYKGPVRLTLFAFGMFSLLYGVRILIAVPAMAQLLGASRRTLFFAVAWINYFLPAFGLLFAEQIRGRGWMSLLRRLWQAGFVLAPVFVANDAWQGAPWASLAWYRPYVIAAMSVLLVHVVLWRHRDPVETSVRTVGTAVLALSIIHDTVATALPWNVSLEVYGVSVFILALGVVTARRFFADQRELAAVERELETARTIQASILPRELPNLGGARVGVRYIPASSVAGDVYDFLTIDEQRLGVLVADVSGHGVPAALIASMATVAFSSQKAHAHDPGRTLGEINRVIAGYFDARFVTAAYLYFDFADRQLCYSLAGHPPPLLWKADTQQLVSLETGSTVLGLFPDATYPSEQVAIEPGDRVVAYTDGLTDAGNRAGDWFGERGLKTFIREHAALPPDAFIDTLVAQVARWAERPGPRFDDDVTVVVIDVR